MLRVIVGRLVFVTRLEPAVAPACVAFAALLSFRNKPIQARLTDP